MSSTLLIVDASHLLHRVLHVEEIAKLGKFGGIFGFLRSLYWALEQQDVIGRCVAIWDGGLSERRLALLPEYKEHRRVVDGNIDEKGEAHRRDFNRCRGHLNAMLPLLAVPSVIVDKREGDDVIYEAREVWRRMEAGNVVIISEDKDFVQMVDEATTLYRPISRVRVEHRGFEETVGIPRDRYLLYKSLCGDKSDNIATVPGVGEKTAREITLSVPSTSWDDIVSYCESHKSSRVRKVAEGIDIVKRNHEMIRLGAEAFTQEEVREIKRALTVPTNSNLDELQGLFSIMKFNSLLQRGFYDFSIPFIRLGARAS